MIRLTLLALPLVLSACATTQTASTTTGQSNTRVAASAERKLCRSEADLGSIMTKRTCHTAGEWAAIDAANQANAQRGLDARRDGGVQQDR